MPAKKLTADDYRARKIRAAIAAKGLTQKALAKRLDLKECVMSRRINKVSNIKVCELEQLCRALNLSTAEILEATS